MCAAELPRIMGVTPAKLVPGLAAEGPLVETAREVTAKLPFSITSRPPRCSAAGSG